MAPPQTRVTFQMLMRSYAAQGCTSEEPFLEGIGLTYALSNLILIFVHFLDSLGHGFITKLTRRLRGIH